MKFKNYLNKINRNVEDFVRKNVMPLEDFRKILETIDKDKINYYNIMWNEADKQGYANAKFFIKEIEKKLNE